MNLNIFINLSRRVCHKHTLLLHSQRCFANNTKQNENHTDVSAQISSTNNSSYSFEDFDKHLKEFFKDKNTRLAFPPQSSSLAQYISDSKALQFLAQMNMKLYLVEEQHKDCLNFMVRLKLEDIGPKLHYLKSLGVPANMLGEVLTKNPHILNPEYSVAMLQEHVAYFQTKKFSEDDILIIVLKYPKVLTMPVVLIDGMLGFYQNLPTKYGIQRPIFLTADQLRGLIVGVPKLLGVRTADVYDQVRTLEMSCGFNHSQIKRIILGTPNILMKSAKHIEVFYKFFTREMGLPTVAMVLFPQAFNSRLKIIIPRHLYLCRLKRNIYNHKEPGYIPVISIIQGDNSVFCEACKLGPVENYLSFLKTI